ncbi:RAI1 like PD-XK nuclease-domain-containing protein [Massariosphaeria phaeospora]|uniref:Decapping nuclease n=1 Tax=Massariosphaeria phaeospora TaxID=100035 RepID=A0A7C8M4J3_9PLEO|nr:RAI1 like PD-XK nuclease-domain-containing protein [Massariosphaeria phaeospora]
MTQDSPDSDNASVTLPPSLPPKPVTTRHPPPNHDDPSPPRKRPRIQSSPKAPSTKTTSEMAHLPPARFPIQPLNRFQGASASIKRPREVAHFSYDDEHTYREDESSINYYHPPQIGADLKEGFDTFRQHEDTEDPHLDSLLKTLVSKERKEGERIQADFVTWRGMMTKILTAPFDFFAEFDMFATLHDGTIYIEEDFPKRAADRAAEATRPPPGHQNPDQQSHKMMTFWGYKFETLSLLPTPPPSTPAAVIENRPNAVVSNHAQHCSIIRTSFGPHSLIFGGEVDGLWGPKPSPSSDDPIPWIELKTAEELSPAHRRTERDVLKFERKLLKFWAQSFLLGVGKVIVGFRSKAGILRGVDVYETNQIPGMVRRGTRCWDGNTCINFATAFLAFLKQEVKEEGVYKITLGKKAGVVEVKKVQGEGTGNIVSKEFLEWRGRKNGNQTDSS